MSHNKCSVLPKPPFPTKRLDSRVLRGYCGAKIIYGPGPFTRGESKGPSRGGLWPKLDKYKTQDSLEIQPRTVQSSADPKSHRKKGQKRYRTKTWKKNLKYPGKAVLTAIQYSEPDRAVFFDFYNYPQRLWVWADGTSISLGKVDSIRGRRTVNAG